MVDRQTVNKILEELNTLYVPPSHRLENHAEDAHLPWLVINHENLNVCSPLPAHGLFSLGPKKFVKKFR